MNILLIILGVIIVLAIVVGLATIPMVQKKEDASIKVVKDTLGEDNIIMVDKTTVAMGFDPASASGIKARACLGATKTEVMAVGASTLEEWKIDRSTITKVDCEAPDPTEVAKASIMITYTAASGPVTAKFRLKDPVPWLTELGYDWGPDGPPVADAGEDDED